MPQVDYLEKLLCEMGCNRLSDFAVLLIARKDFCVDFSSRLSSLGRVPRQPGLMCCSTRSRDSGNEFIYSLLPARQSDIIVCALVK
jgi:hypothetical protein